MGILCPFFLPFLTQSLPMYLASYLGTFVCCLTVATPLFKTPPKQGRKQESLPSHSSKPCPYGPVGGRNFGPKSASPPANRTLVRLEKDSFPLCRRKGVGPGVHMGRWLTTGFISIHQFPHLDCVTAIDCG